MKPGLETLNTVTSEYSTYFASLGYSSEKPVEITSNIDPSVRLIGAPISVMKPYLLETPIEGEGVAIVQNCIRTQNLNSMFEIDQPQEYGSFFTGLGALVPPENTSRLFQETSVFLSDKLGLDPESAFISVFSGDQDMLDAAEANGVFKVQPDVMPYDYYRHGYGMPGVVGRNSSYWVKNSKTGEYEDLGNVILIENDKGELGSELAFGDTTIVKQMAGLDHVLDAYNLNLVDNDTEPTIRSRLEDSVITTLALASEGLKPGASNNQTRILRSYMKAIGLFRNLAGIDAHTLDVKLEEYESGVLPFDARGMGRHVMKWVTEYEYKLSSQGPSNEEDAKILDLTQAYRIGK